MKTFILGKQTILLLLLILFFAALLRVIFLDKAPISLSGDELDVGYQAFSLWKTGRDYSSHRLPLYLQSFTEWRTPLLSYLLAPSVALLGLNEWGVRLPVAIFGLLDILLLFILVKTVTKNSRLALICALVMAVLPWHIHYSRLAFDTTLFLALITLGVVAFLGRKWLISVVCFASSFYTYNTANIFVPLLILGMSFLLFPKTGWPKRKLVAAGFLSIILCLPLFWTIIRGEGAARFRSINIFNDPKVVDTIVFKRTTGAGKIERVFHNKLTAWGKAFLNNYLISFSPQFLFINGDPNPRQNLPKFGELYLLMFPFLIVGIWNLLKSKDDILKKLTFAWLFLAPLPSALTLGGGNHATRLSLMIPPLVILVAYGAISFLHSKKIWFAFICLLMISLSFWVHEYFVHYGKEQSLYLNYGYKEAFVWLREHQQEYPKVILNNNHDPILLRYVFWVQKNASWVQKEYKGDTIQKNTLPGFDGFTVDNVYLGGISSGDRLGWLKENLDDKTIYLAFQKDEVPGDWNWEKSPPKGIRVLKMVKDAFSGEPYIYLLTKE